MQGQIMPDCLAKTDARIVHDAGLVDACRRRCCDPAG
jgi:hypothetical protein